MASQTNDNCWLVVWNMNFIFQYLGNVIIPNDFQSIIFQGWLKHQPDVMFINENMGPREDMEWQPAMFRRVATGGWVPNMSVSPRKI
jgi:hypothetical protein